MCVREDESCVVTRMTREGEKGREKGDRHNSSNDDEIIEATRADGRDLIIEECVGLHDLTPRVLFQMTIREGRFCLCRLNFA